MPLLKGTAFATDEWTTLGLEDPVPAGGDIVVPFARLQKEPELLGRNAGRLGVVIANSDRVEALSLLLPKLALVVLPFPGFADGRAYSLARQLRGKGYRGELRASGNVLPDQLQFMLQVGFDSFEVGERFPQEAWLKASRQMSLAYQRGLYRPAGEAEVWTERHTLPDPLIGQPKAG